MKSRPVKVIQSKLISIPPHHPNYEISLCYSEIHTFRLVLVRTTKFLVQLHPHTMGQKNQHCSTLSCDTIINTQEPNIRTDSPKLA